jgi:hypothetical protein
MGKNISDRFFEQMLLKLAGNVNDGKTGNPLFYFTFEKNTSEDIHFSKIHQI